MPSFGSNTSRVSALNWTCCLRIFLAISVRCQRVQWWPTVGVGTLTVWRSSVWVWMSGSRMLLPVTRLPARCVIDISLFLLLSRGRRRRVILLKVTAIKAKEAPPPTRTITTWATATATIVAIYVSSFVLPLSRSVAMGQHMFNCQIGAIRHNSCW